MKIIYDGSKSTKMFRDVLGGQIMRLVTEDPDVVYLDADLMRCLGTLEWAQTTDRAIDCGIAEANMIGIAAGLSSAGFKPIVHSFGPFMSRRVFDQVFLSGAYAGNSITILGTDPGITAEKNGGTHMPFEDMALYRTIPGAMVFDISDPNLLQNVLTQSINVPGIKYIRCPRKSSVSLYSEGHFQLGKGITLRDGDDIAIIASGIMVEKAMAAAQILLGENISARVIDMFTVKPLDRDLIQKAALQCRAIVTCENHNIIGGLSAAVSQVLTSSCPVPQECVAVEDQFGEVGPLDYLEERFNLTVTHILESCRRCLLRKNA